MNANRDDLSARGSPAAGEEGSRPDRWDRWRSRRPRTLVDHLDSAAAGRASYAVQRAVTDHARLEAETGAYVAQGEAAPILAQGRSDIAGLLGVHPHGLAFVESASAARAALLAAWPLKPGATIGVLASEWGQNLDSFVSCGSRLIDLPADGDGRLDLDRFERLLAVDPPAVVHLTQVAAHRGLVQPVASAGVLCRAAGVPLWVDAAQSLGQVDAAAGADAVYSTSRKWLCGPRGIGVVGIEERWWPVLRVRHRVLAPSDEPTVHAMESDEAHIAGRVGLAAAVAEFIGEDPQHVWNRLDEVGRMARSALTGIPGWQVVDKVDAGTAITALRATASQDVVTVRARLLVEHGILTTAFVPARAPRELDSALLRVSPHVDCAPQQLDRLGAALAQT